MTKFGVQYSVQSSLGLVIAYACADPEKNCQKGSNFDNGFLVDEGGPNTIISGPSSVRQ